MILKRQEENKFTASLIQETGITNILDGKFFLSFCMLQNFFFLQSTNFLSALKIKPIQNMIVREKVAQCRKSAMQESFLYSIHEGHVVILASVCHLATVGETSAQQLCSRS